MESECSALIKITITVHHTNAKYPTRSISRMCSGAHSTLRCALLMTANTKRMWVNTALDRFRVVRRMQRAN